VYFPESGVENVLLVEAVDRQALAWQILSPREIGEIGSLAFASPHFS
jgi:hypothetical protein